MNTMRGDTPRWGPVDRSRSIARGVQPAETRQVRSEPRAERVDAKAELRAADPWEATRQELVDGGRIFDEEGNITEEGETTLRAAGWNNDQMITMERLQKSRMGEVRVVQEAPPVRERAAMSARERPQVFADARAAAEKALRERAAADAAVRKAQGERAMAGMRARSNAVFERKSEAEADRLQREAEQRYDLQKQREQNLRAAV